MGRGGLLIGLIGSNRGEDVKVGGELSTCVAMVEMISQIILFLFP